MRLPRDDVQRGEVRIVLYVFDHLIEAYGKACLLYTGRSQSWGERGIVVLHLYHVIIQSYRDIGA
jgi:hypothetical protein